MHTAEIDTLTINDDPKASLFSSSLEKQIEARVSRNNKLPKKISHYFYTIGSYNLVIEQGIKVENFSDLVINKVPHAPEWFSGIVNIRGVIMPVVNMHSFLKTGIETSNQKNKFLMLEYENLAPIIFQIDKLPEIVYIDDYTKEETPENSPEWLTKSLKNKKNTLYKIDHKKLFWQLKDTQR